MIVKIEIPNYIRRIKVSEKRIPRYYKYNGISIRSKKKDVPRKYIKPERVKNVINNFGVVCPLDLKDTYTIVAVHKTNKKIFILTNLEQEYNTLKDKHHFRLYNLQSKEFVLANPRTAKTPNHIMISGQSIYSGKGGEFSRGLMMDKIKESFAPYVSKIPIFNGFQYPLRVKLYIYDTVTNILGVQGEEPGQRWDVGNRAYPYGKAFLDLLANGYNYNGLEVEKKIIDDDRLHITEDPQGGVFCPIVNQEDNKLVFVVGTDNEEFLHSHIIKNIEEERIRLLKRNKYYRNE